MGTIVPNWDSNKVQSTHNIVQLLDFPEILQEISELKHLAHLRDAVLEDYEEFADELRLKAAHTNRSISDLVNEAIRRSLHEDQEDLAAFEERAAEPEISYEALLNDLKA